MCKYDSVGNVEMIVAGFLLNLDPMNHKKRY
jgi:hypothetical protein